MITSKAQGKAKTTAVIPTNLDECAICGDFYAEDSRCSCDKLADRIADKVVARLMAARA